MIQHILISKLPLIIYNPFMVFDENYFAACANAGALPVFDSEYFTTHQIIKNIDILSEKDHLFGIKIDIEDTEIIDYLKNNFLPNLDLVVFSYKTKGKIEDFSLDEFNYKFFIEAKDIDLTKTFERLLPDGLILKGNEAPGKVSQYTSFILMQWYLKNNDLPVFIHGGVGMYTAAGIFAAGASGIVLDNQLYLTDESPVSDNFKDFFLNINENDTEIIGDLTGVDYRFFAKLGTKIVNELKKEESLLADNQNGGQIISDQIKKNITALNDAKAKPLQSLFYIGQDASFAKSFKGKIKDVIYRLFNSIHKQLDTVDAYDPLVAESPLAKAHGTKYPVIQGPMANISDNPDFANIVYENGGLPFFAMGNLPAGISEDLIAKGKEKVKTFGCGLIGIESFNKTIQTHFDLVKKYKVPFALFAGGIPSQVNELESAGIKTYLHTPNMSMLDNAIENNCKRFIFEGCEAGGHVGTLTSFVLWESAVSKLISQKEEKLKEQTIIFAGGISTVYASCFISGLSSFLSKMGVKIGVQVGSAYLFTKEIVDLKSVGSLYQNTISKFKKTIITGNTVGLPSRTVPTPFAKKLVEKEHKRISKGVALGERKTSFEKDNLGSLLIGAKGFLPDVKGVNKGKLNFFNEKEQYEMGNFLVGDSLAFLEPGISISQIHNMYFNEKKILVDNMNYLEIFSSPRAQVNDEIAIIGKACILPDAKNSDELWDNILSKKYSIKQMPENRLDKSLYYDEDKKAEDKTYTLLAGFVDNFEFDHNKYGYTKDQAQKMSRTQQMILEAAFQAVENSGYLNLKPGYAEKTGVIIASCLGSELGNELQLKYYYPLIRSYLEQIDAYKALSEEEKDIILNAIKKGVSTHSHSGFAENEITPDPSDGAALNIEASRIAKHLGAKGASYVVDAACATSFAAMDCAINELLSGKLDMVVTGGINTNLSPEAFIGFGKMGAISAKGSWPFDDRADGFVLGEGCAVFVLKRLKDAIRDNDKIAGIIKGIGSSSDGKGKAIAAPNPKGQELALKRCYENMKSKINFSDIDYIEAHGTSTIMGDQAEIETLNSIYKSDSLIGVSSIKSQIGHLLGGAGAAGLMKVLLALEHKIIPPNGDFRELSKNFNLEDSNLYIINNPKKWEIASGKTRKAAISSYGFGGINYHVVIEEFSPFYNTLARTIFSDLDYDYNDNRIVITGLGAVLPGAENIEKLKKVILKDDFAVSAVTYDCLDNHYYYEEKDPVFNLSGLKAGIIENYKFNNVKYKIPPMAAKSVDPAQLFALDSTNQAIENSGLSAHLNIGNKTAVILGTVPGKQHSENILRVRSVFIEKIINSIVNIDEKTREKIGTDLKSMIRGKFPKTTEDSVPGFLSNIVSGRIANYFGCNGANFVVNASCASSAKALDLAKEGLKSGDFEFVITGGVDSALYPQMMFQYKSMGFFNENNTRVMSEGASVVVMTQLKTAKKYNMPILAEIGQGSFHSCADNTDSLIDSKNIGSKEKQFGCMRAASTAVDITKNILIKNEKADMGYKPYKSSISALGGLEANISTRALPAFLSGKVLSKKILSGKPVKQNTGAVVALLSGQGSQFSGMMKELYNTIGEIKEIMDRAESIFKAIRSYSLLEIMFGDDEKKNLTENTQPAVFLSTVAIYSYLKKRGFSPDWFIGHSVGEFSALFCSGMLDFEEAFKLIIKRSTLMKEAAEEKPGKIMVVFQNAVETETLIRKSNIESIYIANKNSEKQTAVSGSSESIIRFCSYLSNTGISYTKLSLSGAFHTPLFKNAADKLADYMKTLHFKTGESSKIISNVTGKPYPLDIEEVKALLIRQITSPVEFIKSVEFAVSAYESYKTSFIEIGPIRLLINLLKNININIDDLKSKAAVEIKNRQSESFASFIDYLTENNLIKPVISTGQLVQQKEISMSFTKDSSDDFNSFINENENELKKLLYNEYLKKKKYKAIEAFENFDFNPGKIVVSGVSVGLPGKTKKVFDPENFNKLLNGTNFIEPVSLSYKERMVDKNVTRLAKAPDGNARFVEISSTDDVIQLAGQLGYFDLEVEYGIKKQYDTTIALAMAAGIEALKDANIPLVMEYKVTSTGTKIQTGYALPKEMQKNTGVILSALWPYSETLIKEMTAYYYNKFYVQPYGEFEKIYYHLMGCVTDAEIKDQITNWFFKVKERKNEYGTYKLERDFAHNITPLGSAHFAQYIQAKGPNIQMSGACASTTQAIGIAEDWIRAGRCERVIIIGGETATSEAQGPWIGSGFLSLGAASIKRNVDEAAKPFDAKRNGTILGSGAVSLIIEKEELVKRRGLNGQAEVLGTHIGNTAYHTYNIDVNGIAEEMNSFVSKVEKRHKLVKKEYSKKLVFMSHETYTPARGGSADAEITALRTVYPDTSSDILISNTKGYTGHTLGAALEDAVLVKVLQNKTAPPIANLKDLSENFKDLKLNKTVTKGDFEYGLHIAAGFGSHLAFVFFKRIQENSVENNPVYTKWLNTITESSQAALVKINNTLCVEAKGEKIAKPAIPVLAKAEPKVEIQTEVRAQVEAEKVQVIIPAVKQKSENSIKLEIQKVIAEQTGYDIDMLEDDLDLEADLGIDTVKQVEIFAQISGKYKLKVPENLKLKDLNTISKLADYLEDKVDVSVYATIPAATQVEIPKVQQKSENSIKLEIKKVVAEQTGYDIDMLEDDLDLEADLGIDTVKQVEIFAQISGKYKLKVPENLKLKDLNTISKLADYLEDKVDVSVYATIPADTHVEIPKVQPNSENSIKLEIKKVVAEQTGYDIDMLEDDLDLEADLGIDTVKQVEIFAQISGKYKLKVPENLKLKDLNTISKLADYLEDKVDVSVYATIPADTHVEIPKVQPKSENSIKLEIKKVVAEQTGYDVEMLEDDLDLEADLGIDTVKQVEIFAQISGKYKLKVPENLKLKDLNTISKLADYLEDKVDVSVSTIIPAETHVEIPKVQPKSENSIKLEIKKVVAEQTGYEIEMLEDDLDLEADLGIDTVKQVEIFAQISGKYKLKVPENLKLKDLNTISKLADYLDDKVDNSASVATTAPVAARELSVKVPLAQTAVISSEVQRFVVKIIQTNLPKLQSDKFKDKRILISADKYGFAAELTEQIRKAGGRPISVGNFPSAKVQVDFTDPVKAEQSIRDFISVSKPIDGFIHLAPLDYFFQGSKHFAFLTKRNNEQDEINTSLSSFFTVIKALAEQLDKKGAIISALSFNSVVFPYLEGFKGNIHPAFSGMAGMMKTINKEFQNTNVRIVDFASEKPLKNISDIISTYLRELLSDESCVETAYKNGIRYIPRLVPDLCKNEKSFIENKDTILVTGGALGITYEILKKTAEKYNADLIILGRSDIFALDAAYLLPNVDDKAIMSKVKTQMNDAKPIEIKRAVEKIIRTRTAVLNIKKLQDQGVNVIYESVDVTDFSAVERIIKKHKKINGIIHAAGLEESQFINKKELSSFNRVINVKIQGIKNLLEAMKNRDYRFFITFSSVTARLGNEGQIDYTGANDMIGKILFKEKINNPFRYYKIYSWTAWSGAGMAENETVKKVLEMRGISFLPLEKGINFFLDDLNNISDTEVVISAPDYSADTDNILGLKSHDTENISDDLSASFPFLDKKIREGENETDYSRLLSLKKDLFLFDHSMDDTPIFLGATGIETMSEAALAMAGNDKKVVEISEFSIPYGIKILKGKDKELTISAKQDKNDKDLYRCSISSIFKNSKNLVMGDPKLHYQSTIRISDVSPENIVLDLPEFTPVNYTGDAETLIYHPKRLFMDDLFKTLVDVVSFDGELLITKFKDRSTKDFFSGVNNPLFQSDVVAVDAMFQTGGLLEFFTTNSLVLPYNIDSMKFYKRVEKGEEYFCLTRKTNDGTETNTYHIDLVDSDGNLFIRAENFEMVKLNSLDEEYRILDRIKA